jgi:dipeptidyl aminopeptidase/acylaminoacyl peptidase
MQFRAILLVLALGLAGGASSQVPDNLVADGLPPIPPELRADAGPYLEFRSAAFNGWHPQRRELLITTRFGDAAQLHVVRQPGGARRQMTFTPEPVGGAQWQPKHARYLVFSQDTGGGEFYQYYRLDPGTGRIALLTDGKSRNGGGVFARSGAQFAYTSTRRNGRDTDIYVMDPANPATDRCVRELKGGGWRVSDWSPDETRLLLQEYLSINHARLHLLDLKTGALTLLTPDTQPPTAYDNGRFARDGQSLFYTSDKDSEFHRLVRRDLRTGAERVLTPDLKWDVTEFDLSPDGKTIAYITNEDGVGKLKLMDARTGRPRRSPQLPLGIPGGVAWHENGRELAFNFTSARSPADVYSFTPASGKVERWTESETGGLDASRFREPELVRTRSFDGLTVSGFLYRPDPARFPGPRPVIVIIHGGPESQSRPIFQGRNNYYLEEMGVALFFPNVRGSSGYGKTFLTLDNGLQREDSVKDIGAFLDWLAEDAGVDRRRIAVMGGSYGGYMTLASLVHFGDRLRCGVDIVGISNFLTFLKNTQDYRRDLRRVEYGDERDPAMAEFLHRISPLTNVEKIRRPLFVVQGLNDPRVPASEAEQIVQAVRAQGGAAWYLLARDEGHGFAKKRNSDYQFLSTILFFREHLLR